MGVKGCADDDVSGKPGGNLFGDADRLFSGAGRGRGRPKGAQNKKTQVFEKYYAARGFTDPLMVLGDLVSADPIALWEWLKENNPGAKVTLLDVIELIRKSANDLAPYLHGKKPIDVNITDERLPMLVIDSGNNQLDEDRRNDGSLSIVEQLIELANVKDE